MYERSHAVLRSFEKKRNGKSYAEMYEKYILGEASEAFLSIFRDNVYVCKIHVDYLKIVLVLQEAVMTV